MSISGEISRIFQAKSDLKRAIEVVTEQSIGSSTKIDRYASILLSGAQGIYIDPPSAPGVYIKYRGGVYSDYNNLISDRTPVGVAIKTNACAFTLHPSQGNGSFGVRENQRISGVTTVSSENNVAYNGAENTTIAINSGEAGSAFTWARSLQFADGSTGFLLSSGELEAARLNDSAVNTALSLIGGTQMNWGYWAGGHLVTSIQYMFGYGDWASWGSAIWDINNQMWTMGDTDASYRCRAGCQY